jgi:CheY-like chemotaxis protein/nitrogen-specific signal transduction histidine kinase
MAYAIYNGFNHRENCIYYEKTMVHELEIEKEIAQHATEAKSNFLANMSHEIRTPINAVLGMDELILRECEEDNIREYAVNIQRSGNMLLSLVNNILDFSKIEAGRMELEPERYDFGALIRDIVDITRPRAERKGIKLYTEVDAAIPRYLFGDPVRIKQCISNILTNAVKYTSQGHVKLSIRLIAFNEGSATIDISIEDTGIGIREKDIERLFTAFERIDVRRNRTVEGTGLGMNIVQSLLALMDSKLNVKSVYGEGSLFSFELEQEVLAKEVIGDINKQREDEHKSYTESYIAPHARILMVDDAEMNLKVGAGLLKMTQIQVDTAHSGEEALKKLEETEYDVLLLDHMMPEMDGIEAMRHLRDSAAQKGRNICIVALTANAVSGAKEMFLREGFDGFISKPININDFDRTINRLMPMIRPGKKGGLS